MAHDTQRVECDQPDASSVPTKYQFQKNSEAAVENPADSLTTAKHTFESLDAASFYMYRVGAVLVAFSGLIPKRPTWLFCGSQFCIMFSKQSSLRIFNKVKRLFSDPRTIKIFNFLFILKQKVTVIHKYSAIMFLDHSSFIRQIILL